MSENIRLSCHFNTFLTFFKLTFIFTDFLFVVRHWPHIFLLVSLRQTAQHFISPHERGLTTCDKSTARIHFLRRSQRWKIIEENFFIAKNLRLNNTNSAAQQIPYFHQLLQLFSTFSWSSRHTTHHRLVPTIQLQISMNHWHYNSRWRCWLLSFFNSLFVLIFPLDLQASHCSSTAHLTVMSYTRCSHIFIIVMFTLHLYPLRHFSPRRIFCFLFLN